MKDMRYNIKGIGKFLCSLAMILSAVSCSEGVDETFVPQYLDDINMNIVPAFYRFGISRTYTDEEKPDSMVVLYDRVIRSWRGACIVDFEYDSLEKAYLGDGRFYNPNDSSLTKARYNMLAYTYDPRCFVYDDMFAFLNRENGSSIFKQSIAYNVSSDKVVISPTRIITTMSDLDNYYILTTNHNSTIEMSPVDLTQRFNYTFYIYKTDDVASIDAVYAEIEGVPYSINIRNGVVDASKLYKVRAFGDMKNELGFKSGRDTVSVTFDVTTVLAPNDKDVNELIANDEPHGYLHVYLSIRNKAGKTKLHHVRYKMTELDTEKSSSFYYTVEDDKSHIKPVSGYEFSYKIDHDILVNQDTVTSVNYGWWTVVK